MENPGHPPRETEAWPFRPSLVFVVFCRLFRLRCLASISSRSLEQRDLHISEPSGGLPGVGPHDRPVSHAAYVLPPSLAG